MSFSGANNVTISPVNALWQVKANDCVDFQGLTGASFKGTYFELYLADGSGFYVWGDDSVEVDPAPAGLTAIPVTVTGDSDTAATLATAAQAAIDAVAGFSAVVSGSTIVDIRRDDFGSVQPIGQATFTGQIITVRTGKDYDLGLLDGDVEFSFAPSNFIVQAHQTGVTPRAALFQGAETVEVTTTLLETQTSRLKEIYDVYGGAFTPGAGTEVFGVGTSKQGENLLVDAARLKLRPVNAVDATSDTVVMLCIPIPDTLTFSGENPRTLSVTWQGFVDDSFANAETNIIAFGDVEQP